MSTLERHIGESGGLKPGAVDLASLHPREWLFNRDISWLRFNRRVLAQAADERLPLLERVKFLGIFTSNLDEFFMKRVALLRSREAAGPEVTSPDGMTVQDQLRAIRREVRDMLQEQDRIYLEKIQPALRDAGICLLRYNELTVEQQLFADEWFRVHVFPVLTPLAVDAARPFPFISNLSNNLGVILSEPGSDERKFARLKMPPFLPGFVRVPPGEQPARSGRGAPGGDVPADFFISMQDLIHGNIHTLFPGMQLHEVFPFRLTRGAGIERDDADETEDVLESVEEDLKLRRFAEAVRLAVSPRPSDEALALLMKPLKLDEEDVYERAGPLDYTSMFMIADLPRPDLKEKPFVAVTPPRLADESRDIFSIIRERDVFLHHPYESFGASVEKFIAVAARDPDVLAIKQTIYRTSRDSPFVKSLIRASEEGKSVSCLVELRARFDEERNVRFAHQLEKAGVHVSYGVVGLKTHCKCSLVVRREADGPRCYVHLGTGNYNPTTAQMYTDCGILTCDPLITEDVVHLFNCLTGFSQFQEYQRLLVAPFTMRQRFTRLIERERDIARAGGRGRIIAKLNSLEDLKITRKLYEASQAGVRIVLIVRGFCCLKPGVPGLSDNIRVISVVGRFLEHSRIYYFGAGKENPLDGDWFIGSADWMYRNLNDRIEVVVPIGDPEARRRLKRILDVMQADRRNAWDLMSDGTYVQRMCDPDVPANSPEALGTFETLAREARAGRSS